MRVYDNIIGLISPEVLLLIFVQSYNVPVQFLLELKEFKGSQYKKSRTPLKNLPQEPTVRDIYYSWDESDTCVLQSIDSVLNILAEATIPPQASSLIGRFGWTGESYDDQEENVEMEEEEFEAKEENEYENKLREVYESRSLSVFGVVRPAERSLVLKQFDYEHRDPSPSHMLAATHLDQSMFDLRLAERSLDSNHLHSYHSDLGASQAVSNAKYAMSSKLLDSSVYIRSPEKSIKSDLLDSYHSHPPASQSASFAGNPTNSELSYSYKVMTLDPFMS